MRAREQPLQQDKTFCEGSLENYSICFSALCFVSLSIETLESVIDLHFAESEFERSVKNRICYIS